MENMNEIVKKETDKPKLNGNGTNEDSEKVSESSDKKKESING